MNPEVHKPIPVPTRRPPGLRPVRIGVWLVLLLLATAVGALLITDHPGLEERYFALGAPWEGKVLYETVGDPRLDYVSQVDDVLLTEVAFSIHWTGWWDVARAGEHRFVLDADDGGYLRIDGELVADTSGIFGAPTRSGSKTLATGFHAVEVGLFQRHGESRLAIRWIAPGSGTPESGTPGSVTPGSGAPGSETAGPEDTAASLPVADLYSGRPLQLRKILRRTLSSWSRPYRQLLGVVFLIAIVIALRRFVLRSEKASTWIRARLEVLARPGPRAALLLGFFVFAFIASFPFTGPLRGGDDTAYLLTATFNLEGWFYIRYGHVHLLKLFTALCGGDPLTGARVWWSFIFAATVSALAVAVRSVGDGVQLRTLAATLFVFLSQGIVVGFIGAPFSDYSAMMFVTLAVAAYMRGFVSCLERPPPRHEWYALAVGVLTAGAFRSKETGAVLLLLPLLFAFVDGRFDLRRFARRLGYWTAGVVGVLALLMVLDGVIFGDVFFTMGPDRLQMSGGRHFPEGMADRPDAVSWFHTIWLPGLEGIDLSLRFLWLGVCAAAVAAGVHRRRPELRLLHLLPIAYVLALIALYIRMPHLFSVRMLVPILPVAALMTGLLLHYAGLDDLPWKRMFSPGPVIFGGLLTGIVFFVLIPYRRGALEAADFLPVAWLHRYGWTPDHFALGVLLPAGVLIAFSVVALGAGRRRVRVIALAAGFLALFGTGFEIGRDSLARHFAVQASDLLTYPWKVFEQELTTAPSGVVRLSNDLKWRYRMSGAAEASLAQLTLMRSDIWVGLTRDFPADADVTIASKATYANWMRQQAPALERVLVGTARWDPFSFLVLLRPKDAAEGADRLRQLQFTADETPGFHEGLAGIADSTDVEARARLLRRILGSEWIPLRRVHGDRLRAVALSADGWTDGTRPAGLIVTNQGDEPMVQGLRLAVHAEREDYPIRVYVDDGERRDTLLFERRDRKELELRPVPPRSSRLVIVWSDKAWSPAADDTQEHGVRILAPAGR